MSRWKSRALAMAMAAPGAIPAGAATLHAGPLFTAGAVSDFRCDLSNVSSRTRRATIEILDATGAIISTSTELPFAPGRTHYFHFSSGANACRFRVQGSARHWRATASVYAED